MSLDPLTHLLRQEAESTRREAKAAEKRLRMEMAKEAVAKVMAREAVEATRRLSMSPARRARLLAAGGGVCSHLGCTQSQGLELDHTIPLELGGEDVDENVQLLCRPHHLQKTRRDIKAIAKARRLRGGFAKPKRPWPYRRMG